MVIYMYMYPWLYTCTCTHGYVHVPMVIYMYISVLASYSSHHHLTSTCSCLSNVISKAGTNSQYQIRSFVKKSFEGFEGSHVFLILFINVALTWIGYRKPCFIMSTNLVPVAVSTRI